MENKKNHQLTLLISAQDLADLKIESAKLGCAFSKFARGALRLGIKVLKNASLATRVKIVAEASAQSNGTAD